MINRQIVTYSLIYAFLVNGYIFIMMITTSPRVWGYIDYPQTIKDKVPPQTKRERTIATLIGIPWFTLVLGYPIVTAYMFKAELGNEFSFGIAFVHFAAMTLLANLGDLIILDWLIISRITPNFVIIPGSEASDYKDFTNHFIGHAKATVIMILLSMILAGIVRFI